MAMTAAERQAKLLEKLGRKGTLRGVFHGEGHPFLVRPERFAISFPESFQLLLRLQCIGLRPGDCPDTALIPREKIIIALEFIDQLIDIILPILFPGGFGSPVDHLLSFDGVDGKKKIHGRALLHVSRLVGPGVEIPAFDPSI